MASLPAYNPVSSSGGYIFGIETAYFVEFSESSKISESNCEHPTRMQSTM